VTSEACRADETDEKRTRKLGKKINVRYHLRDMGVDGRIIINLILKI
jgi:hypothetical protein